MVDETRVRYKAIADFTSLSRSIRTARKNLKDFRDEEAKGNAQSVQGAARATIANNKRADSIRNLTSAYQGQDTAVRRSTVQFIENSRAARSASEAQKSVGDTAKQASTGVQSLEGVTRRAAREMLAARNAADGMGRSVANAGRGFRSTRGEMSRTLTTVDQLNKGFRRLGNWRPHLTPPFIALIPIIAGLLGLINPLVAGLGAAGAAGLGFATSLGSLAGAALGAVPALGTLLSMVFALKTAFGGIGGAFKAFGQTPAGGGGGGGGGGAPARAELTQTEEITRAQEKYARSIQDVQWAQEDLAAARADYLVRLRELRKEVERIALAEAEAAANTQLARENYANVLADPGSTKGEKMAAKAAVERAREDEKDLKAENKKLREDLAEMEKKGPNGDRAVIQAQRALTDALWAQRDAQLALINAQKDTNAAMGGGGGAANAYADALAKLSPSARKFVEIIVGMKDAWDEMKKSVQERFFSEFVDNVGRLQLLFGPLEVLLGTAATSLGKFVDNLILLVTSPAWRGDLELFGKRNGPIIDALGDGALDLLDAFRHIAIVAQEVLLMPMADTFRDWADGFREWVAAGRESGGLATYLEQVRTRLSQWWRIVKNIGKTLFNYGSAAGDFADWVTGGLEKTTEGWLKNSEKALGPNSAFRKYLEDVKPLVSEIKGLFGDFFSWFARVSGDPKNIGQMTAIITEIRDNLGPAISTLLQQLADAEIGPKFVDAVASIVDIIASLANSPAVEVFFTVLNALLEVAKWVVSNPVFGTLLMTIATGFAAIAAVSVVSKFTGLTSLLNLLLKFAKGGKGLPGLLSGIGGALGLLGLGGGGKGKGGAAGTRRGPGGGSAGRRGAGVAGAAGALGSAGFVSGFTANMKLLERQFGLTGLAKDRFILNLQRLSAQFGLTGAASTAAGGVGGAAAGTRRGPGGGSAGRVAGKGGFSLLGSIGKGAAKGVGIGAIATIAATVAGDLIASGAAEGKAGSGQRVGGGVLGAAGAGAGIGALLGSIVPGLGTGIGAAAGGVIGAGAGLMGATPEDIEAMTAEWGNFFSDIGGWIANAWTQFSGWLGGIADGFMTWLTVDLPGWLGDIADGFMNWLTVDLPAWLGDIGEGFMTWLTVDLPYYLGYAAGLFWTWLTVDLPAWLAMVWNGFMNWLTVDMPAWLASVWNGFMNWLTVDMPAWLASVWTGFMNWLTVDLPAWIAQAASDFWNWLTVEVPGYIATAADAFWNWLTVEVPGYVSDAADAFSKWLTEDLPGWVQDVADGFWEFLTVDIPQWFEDALGGIGDFFGGIFGQIEKGAKDAADGKGPNPQGKRNGGPILKRASGGGVPGRGNSDTVPAMLTPGEFVVRKAIVARIGLDNLTKFNAGVMSYAEMLQNAMNQPGKAKQGGGGLGEGVNFLNAGGLVPTMPPGFGGDSPRGPNVPGVPEGGYGSAPVIGGDLVINNPAPEPASDSLPRSIRKVAYLGGRR